MHRAALVVCLVGLASCAGPGAAGEYQWTLDCPKSVERGAGFQFTVHAAKGDQKDVADLAYRFEIAWPADGGHPLKQAGVTGTPTKAHARMAAGTATLTILFGDINVGTAAFEVK